MEISEQFQFRAASSFKPINWSKFRYHLAVASVIGLALIIQIGLFNLGLFRVTADESARSLLAARLSWHNALEPWVWPPFYKIFVGIFLKLYNDVFIVPRLLVGLAGLVLLLIMLQLANALFADRKINLITIALAIPIPARLIFSVTPMSDIYFYLSLVTASLFILRWLQAGRRRDLMFGCAFLGLASTVRYEASFFAVTLLLYLTSRWFRGRGIGVLPLSTAFAILTSFPLFWLIDTYYWYGSFSNLAVTSWQFLGTEGYNYHAALARSPAGSFIKDVLWGPALLLGVAAICRLALKDQIIRDWAGIFFLPLFLITIVMIASMSIPGAAPWRTSGAWVFLLLPFTALALVRISEQRCQRRSRILMLTGLLVLALVPPALRSARIAWLGMLDATTQDWRRDREAGLFIKDELGPFGSALIDASDNLDYLDVMTGSSAPERFVLNSTADPLEVANQMPLRNKYYREANTAMINKYFADQFNLEGGGSIDALTRNNIKLILVRMPRFIQGLDRSALVERLDNFGAWVLYRVRLTAVSRQDAR